MLLVTLVTVSLAVATLFATTMLQTAARPAGDDCDGIPAWSVSMAVAITREWLASLALLIASVLPTPNAVPSRRARRVAVLVPELRCSTRGFWLLRRRLRTAGWATVVGLPRTTSGALVTASALDTCLEQVSGAAEVVLIGHGIGGLLACHVACARLDPRIRRVVTLATPHGGSVAFPYRLLQFSATRGLTPAAAREIDVIAIYSAFDAWLVPRDGAYCRGAFNIDVRGVGHCATLFSRRIADLIVENIGAPLPAAMEVSAGHPR